MEIKGNKTKIAFDNDVSYPSEVSVVGRDVEVDDFFIGVTTVFLIVGLCFVFTDHGTVCR